MTATALVFVTSGYAQMPILWNTEYESLRLLSRPESFTESGSEYVLRVRGGNERSEVTIDKQTGALKSTTELGRACGTLVYGPVPLGPRSLVQFQSDAPAGKVTVRPLDLNAGCAVESVRWTQTVDLPVAKAYRFAGGAVNADTTELRLTGVIDLGITDNVAYSQPVALSMDAKTGAVRYVFVGERIASRFGPGDFTATTLLSDGGLAGVVLRATGRADRLYRVNGAGKLRFATTATDSTVLLLESFELADGSLAVWTATGPGRTPGLEVYGINGQRRGAPLDFDAAIDAALGADYELFEARASVLRASGRLVTAFAVRRTDSGREGVIFAETDANGRFTGAQFVEQKLANRVVTVRNRLYEDSEGALVLFGEGERGMVGIRTRGNLTSGVRTAALDKAWLIYPQPARATLNVSFPESYGGDTAPVLIRDISGRTVLRRVLPKGAPLEVDGVSAGVYSLEIVGAGTRVILIE